MSANPRPLRSTMRQTRQILHAAVLASTIAASLVLALTIVVAQPDDADQPDRAAALAGPSLVAAEGTDGAGEGEVGEDVPVALPLVTYELFLSRDPFLRVVPDPVPETDGQDGDPAPGSDGGNGGGGAAGDPNGSDGGNGGGRPGGVPNGSDADNGGCSGTTEVTCDGRVLSIIEIVEDEFGPAVVLQIDDFRIRAREGDTIDGVFQVIRIQDDRVLLLYGDRVVTLLVEGELLK